MSVRHVFERLGVTHPAYRWNRPNRRCIHCSISEDHVDVDICGVLVARRRARRTVETDLEEQGA